MHFSNPFAMEGNWYKGNLHVHTKNSDGLFTPEEICEYYSEAGYDFLCITDHDRITKAVKVPKNFCHLHGSEIGVRGTSAGMHILGIGLREEFDAEHMSAQEIIDSINLHGAIPVIAHPYLNWLTSDYLLSLRGYAGIEIYNHSSQDKFGKGYSTVHFDELLHAFSYLNKGARILGFAGDDSHSRSSLGGSFVMVKARSLNEKDILNSIRNGCFYPSTGVIINNLEIETRRIRINFSPATDVDFIEGGRFSGGGREIEYAGYEIEGWERHVRIEITDSMHRKAWVNPVYFF